MCMEAARSHHPAPPRDREVIRVAYPDDHMGIAAALRRAFTEAANDRSKHDFDELLRQLN